MNIDDFSKLADSAFKIVSIVSVVGFGSWGVFQYLDAKETKKIERSMVYVNSIQTDTVNESISFISEFWSNFDWDSIPKENRKYDDKAIQ